MRVQTGVALLGVACPLTVWEDLLRAGTRKETGGKSAPPAAPAGAEALPVDRAEELLQLVDREGRAVGAASRGVCHHSHGHLHIP